MNSKTKYLLLGLLYAFNLCWGQSDDGFRHFGLEEGLPSMRIYRMLQDHEGFLWLATDAGVSRFDGKRFENFTTEDGLGDNDIISLVEDHWGRVWFLSYNGRLSYFHAGKIHNGETDDWLSKVENKDPLLFSYIDEKKRLWIGASKHGAFIINGDSLTHLFGGNSDSTITVSVIFSMSNGEVFLTCPYLDRFIYLDDGVVAGKKIFPCFNYSISNAKKSEPIGSRFIVPCGNEIWRCDLEHMESVVLGKLPDGAVVNRIEWPDENTFWIHLMGGGALQFSLLGDKATLVNNWLPKMNISDVLQSNDGGMWFSTLDNGLFLRSKLGGFENVLPGVGAKKIFFNDHGLVYLSGGEVYLQSESRELRPVIKTGQIVKRVVWGSKSKKFFLNTDFRLYSINPNTPSVGGQLEGIDFQRKEKQNTIKSLVEVGRDSILLGLDLGLYLISENEEKLIWPKEENQKTFRLTNLLSTSNGKGLWVGTNSNLMVFQGINGDDPQIIDGIKNQVTELVEDSFGNIWVGTNGDGVMVINDKKTKYSITAKDGLIDNFVREIKVVSDSIVWICTNQGISIVGTKNGAVTFVKSFTSQDGAPPPQYLSVQPIGDELWIGARDGLFVGQWNKDWIEDKTRVQAVVGRVAIQNGIVAIRSNYVLPYDSNDVVIAVHAVSISNGRNARISYRINGEGKWTSMAGEVLDLPNLQPGKYLIEFQSSLLGIKSQGGTATLTFIISPPFWRTWWFLILEILIGLSLIAFFVRIYLKSRARRENVARRLTQSRLTALRSQMNPHFIFNSLSSIQNFVARNDHQEAFLYLARFGKLMRRVLDNSEHDMIPLEEEVETLELYLQLEQLRANNGFDFEISIAEDLEPDFHEVPPTLIQPMLENAIWHGVMHRETKGRIEVEFKLEKDEVVVCRVRDNGVGRAAARRLESAYKKDHKSKGLSITQERLLLLNDGRKNRMALEIIDLTHPDGSAAGTEVVLRVPND